MAALPGLLTSRAFAAVADFDDHLDDVSRDWLDNVALARAAADASRAPATASADPPRT